jgi:hypothetical protein
MQVLYEYCCGVDVHSATVVACVIVSCPSVVRRARIITLTRLHRTRTPRTSRVGVSGDGLQP